KMRRPLERRAARRGRNFWRNAARAVRPPRRHRAVSLPPLPQRPLLLPNQAPCSHGGNQRLPRRRRRPLRPCRLASIPPTWPPALDPPRTLSFGSIRRRVSTTTRERAITGKLTGAPICAKLMRAQPAFAPHGTGNVRPRPTRDRAIAGGAERWLVAHARPSSG